jgi:hypothetical protein
MIDKEGVNLSMAVHHFSLNSHSKDMGEFSGRIGGVGEQHVPGNGKKCPEDTLVHS